MLFRSALVKNNEIDWEVFSLLTDAQQVKLFAWALNLDVSAKEMILNAKFMVEQINDKSREVFLFGTLPLCNLYGCLSPDGSSHT
jgi:hypothetical protein